MAFLDFGKEMINFFGSPKPRNVVTGSPASKRANVPGSKSEEIPFTQPQSEFLQQAVGSAFNAFAGALDTKFKSLEANIETQTKKNEELSEALEAQTKAQVKKNNEMLAEVRELQGQVEKLQKESTERCENPPGLSSIPAPTSAFSTPGRSQGKIPYEMRVVARIGNLGWDSDQATIMKRAKEVLSKAGIAPADYTGLSPTRREGSLAELCFSNPMLLTQAKFAIRDLNKSYREGKTVWLDVKKDREELRPARIVHRISDLISEAESGREDKLPVDKVLNGKYVKVGDDKAGYCAKGLWVWTTFSTSRYTQEFRDMAKAFAEDD